MRPALLLAVLAAAAWAGDRNCVAGQSLVGPGAMAPYGGRGGGRRSGGYVRVQDPAVGFFVTGSSVRQLNGLYGRVDSVGVHLRHHKFQLAYQHDQTGWIMGLASTPHRNSIQGLETEWVIVDDSGRDRFAHKGNTLIPGSGERWVHVHRTHVPGHGGGGSRGAPSSSTEVQAHQKDDIDELPWQIIAILDAGMLRRLRRAYSHYSQNIRHSISGAGLPAPPAQNGEMEPPEPVEELPAAVAKLAAEDFAGAIEAYTAEISAASGSGRLGPWQRAGLLLHRARLERRTGATEASVASISEALNLFPRYKDGLFELGISHLQAGRVDTALHSLLTLLGIERSYPDLAPWVVRAIAARDRVDAALQPLQKARDIARGETLSCLAWRQTGDCDPNGEREDEYDKSCLQVITNGNSGYCECRIPPESLGVALEPADGITGVSSCMHEAFTCSSECDALWAPIRAKAASGGGGETLGPWMVKESAEIRQRVREAHASDDELMLTAWKMSDHYGVLNVVIDHTADELKRAYRQMSRQVHPDKPGGSDAAFQRVAEAYRVLSDPTLRDAYHAGSDFDDPHAGPDDMSFRERIEREYFPEMYPFRPFGDPFERKRQVEDRLRVERAHAEPERQIEHPEL